MIEHMRAAVRDARFEHGDAADVDQPVSYTHLDVYKRQLQGAAVVDPWFQKAGLKALQPYLDPQNTLLDAANTALPTSILYDANGRELWRVVGAIDWQGEEAKALLAGGGV